MLRTLLTLTTLSALTLFAQPAAQAQIRAAGGTPPAAAPAAPEQPGEVTAKGTARVYRKPDHLDVIIGVEVIEPTAGEAYQKAAATMEAALKAIKDLNLSAADYKTGSVDLSPRYERRDYNDNQPAKIIAYTAINTVRIRTSDLKAAPRIIDTALKAGANRVDSVTFGIKEVLEAREEALRMATRAAKRKATVMAESLESSLGRLANVTEATQQYYPWAQSSNVAQVQMSNESGPVAGDQSIEPGMIEIVVDVTLTYTLK